MTDFLAAADPWIWLARWLLLLALLGLAISWVVEWRMRRRARRYTVASIEPRCERAGSQASLTRILRGGVR